MKKNVNLNIDPKREAKRVIFGLISAVIMAVNIKIFVRAGGLYPGGFNGVTRLIQTIFEQFLGIPLPFAPVSLILNAIPAIVSFKAIGKRFTLNTSMIIVVSSILTDFVPSVPITQDPADQYLWRSDQWNGDQSGTYRRILYRRHGLYCCLFRREKE